MKELNFENLTDQQRIERAKQMLRVVEMPDGFHVVQIPGDGEASLTHCVGPQVNRFAAEMQRDELINAAESGDFSGCFSESAREYFDLAGHLEKLIRSHEGDARSLAHLLCRDQPWARDLRLDNVPPPF
ncbi:hypothetical protein [Rhodobacter sp. SY28-1]|uniref:hypothetical protein n=1 Tax=Rhodobacter sp. SY28-1 TaxID=2562317 RepID=UPI0010C14B55|nr:hypothetical protein [Rhodobacter sp. SY28-1]